MGVQGIGACLRVFQNTLGASTFSQSFYAWINSLVNVICTFIFLENTINNLLNLVMIISLIWCGILRDQLMKQLA